ncbi:reverse transcriptase family protein [Luteimonas fraxinea]|uniref:reverse transcriptase family protein n=1 Tax=Luteimonas fraxinea TaxID=2901869 RepID=UPI001E363698|nr:reverse transcriptase family protein [Luteimonas fraxinea]UHH09845.1 reverse transcriptase family protein [Luteimonas fraxinea]
MNKQPLRDLFDAMYHGKHQFADFMSCDVTARATAFQLNERTMYSPDKRLRAYHSFLTLFLFDYFPVESEVAFGYRKGSSAYDAVSPHARSRHFFQADITSFFGSLDSGVVANVIDEHKERSPIEDVEKYTARVRSLVLLNGSLPMGFSTSPVLSNACLYKFDRALRERCQTAGLHFTRYADDLIISSGDLELTRSAKAIVEEVLLHEFDGKLQLNAEKTKLTSIGRKVKILGMVILPNGRITVDQRTKDRIEVLIHFYRVDQERFLALVKNDRAGGLEHLAGLVSYVNTVDQEYLGKLRRKFGVTIVDSLLHKTIL